MAEFRIKEILKEKGITGKALADSMGKAPQYINNIVNGGKGASLNTLTDIASALNVPIWQLFASPAEVAGDSDFLAIIKYNGELKEVTSVGELEKIVSELKKGAK